MNLQELHQSKVYLGIVSPDFLKDGHAAMMLGHAIFMEKPIFLLVLKGTKVPIGLVRVATQIETIDPKNDGEMKAAADKFAARIKAI